MLVDFLQQPPIVHPATCGSIVPGVQLGSTARRYQESKTPQIAMLFVALTYLLYALNASTVRDMLGMPTSGTNAVLDAVQPATALCILLVSLLKVCW